MTKAILDSSFLVALIDEKDKWRNTAVLIQKALKKKKARLAYLDCAVNEMISVIARRLEEGKKPGVYLGFAENGAGHPSGTHYLDVSGGKEALPRNSCRHQGTRG